MPRPRVLASLRNLAINSLRLAGGPDISEATRWAKMSPRHAAHPDGTYPNRDQLKLRGIARWAGRMTIPFTILGLTG